MAMSGAVMDALLELPALRSLHLEFYINMQTTVAAGNISALLAADPPNFSILDLDSYHHVEDLLAPVLDALAANTHLRELRCCESMLSEAFRRDRLAPALAALAARPPAP